MMLAIYLFFSLFSFSSFLEFVLMITVLIVFIYSIKTFFFFTCYRDSVLLGEEGEGVIVCFCVILYIIIVTEIV